MKAIEISTLSKEHEGLRISFDCPVDLGTETGVLHAIMPDGSKRLLNTELEWRYHGRNDLETEPGVGLFQHVHAKVWIKMYLDSPVYAGRMLWIEESPTEKLIDEVAKYLESRSDIRGQVEVRVIDATGTQHFFRERP